MYIGSQKLMQSYDHCLLEHGYSIVELVDKASDCLLKHMHGKKYSLLCGPGNNLSLIHILRCRRSYACRSRWSPYH